jgi:SAM-dependent methyltransferase
MGGAFVKIDPPGSWCQYESVMELVAATGAKSFVEVGCGAGGLSMRLCQRGLRGVGVDLSEDAIRQAEATMVEFIGKQQFSLFHGDVSALRPEQSQVDLGISMMVMEHVEDDVGFIEQIARHVKPDGHLLIGVPGRRDRWGIEDETVGHLRRYDRSDLAGTLTRAGLADVEVRSVAVPVANILFHIGNRMIRGSQEEMRKTQLSAREQTATSGIREIPWKTVFPPWVRILLNRVTLYPLFLLQRLFYGTDLGLTMVGIGRVPTLRRST